MNENNITDQLKMAKTFEDEIAVEPRKRIITDKNDPRYYHGLITARDLANIKFPEEPWLIKNILYSQGFCFIYGAEGIGKSFIALSMAIAVATGNLWLGRFKTSKTNVLVLDKENPLPLIAKRFRHFRNSENAGKNIFWLKRPELFRLTEANGEPTEFAKSLISSIEADNIGLIIFDSFVDFIEGNESSAIDTQVFFNTIRSLYPNVGYVVLHHENKPSQGVFRNSSQRLRGSSNINAQAFTMFRLEPVAKSKTDLTIQQTKSRSTQKMDKFMVRMVIKDLDMEDTAVSDIEYLGEITDVIKPKKTEEIETMILEMLQDADAVSYKNVMEIGIAKGIGDRTIRSTISDLLNKQTIFASYKKTHKGKDKWLSLKDLETPLLNT